MRQRIHLSPLSHFFPIATLLHPRELLLPILGAVIVGAAVGAAGMIFFEWALWMAAAAFLAIVFVAYIFKWRADANRYGWIAMGISFLLLTQGFHSIEHLVQWFQYHVLNWTMRASSGILSPANSEWVHFTWNWLVLLAVVVLVLGGLRNPWAWLLLLWSAAHTFEHTYMFVRYLQVLNAMQAFGVTNVTAQGLPGILGQGGWLALSDVTRGTFLCRLPGLTTALRLDVHFWWNMGEIALLLLASHTYLRHTLPHTRSAATLGSLN